jgi:hypothetical protein
MEAAKCVANSLLEQTVLSSQDRFREYIKSNISNLDTSEYNMSFSNKNTTLLDDGVFIIKSCSENNKCELMKESRLGLEFLNGLRQITPCFRYIFGYINCSPIISDSSSLIICPTDGPGYCIVEKIEGISLSDFINLCTFKEYMKVLILLLLSLNCTKGIKLTIHQCNNVKIRVLDEEMMFNFNVNDKLMSISSKYIPVIMDFSYSSYDIDNDEICDYVELYDGYCFFAESYKIVKDFNKTFLNELTPLLNWFGLQSRKSVMFNYLKFISLYKNDRVKSLDEFIKKCYTVAGELSQGIVKHQNVRFNTELSELGMNSYSNHLSFIEYYDLKYKNAEQASKHFDFTTSFSTEIDIISRIREQLNFKTDIEELTVDRMYTVNYLCNFKKRANAFLVYLSNFHRLKLHVKIGKEILAEHNPDFLNFYDGFDRSIQNYKIWILKMKEKIMAIDTLLQTISDDNLNCFKWYKYGINLLVNAINNENII